MDANDAGSRSSNKTIRDEWQDYCAKLFLRNLDSEDLRSAECAFHAGAESMLRLLTKQGLLHPHPFVHEVEAEIEKFAEDIFKGESD